MTAAAADARVASIVAWFERLAPADLAHIGALYTDDARFKDPFSEVQGTAAIGAVFGHMFRTLDAPRFVVRDTLVQGDQCFLIWEFTFGLRRGPGGALVVRGGSHLRLVADGRICMHRDYWDAAEELYEKLPVVGALMRWLKKRVNTG